MKPNNIVNIDTRLSPDQASRRNADPPHRPLVEPLEGAIQPRRGEPCDNCEASTREAMVMVGDGWTGRLCPQCRGLVEYIARERGTIVSRDGAHFAKAYLAREREAPPALGIGQCWESAVARESRKIVAMPGELSHKVSFTSAFGGPVQSVTLQGFLSWWRRMDVFKAGGSLPKQKHWRLPGVCERPTTAPESAECCF